MDNAPAIMDTARVNTVTQIMEQKREQVELIKRTVAKGTSDDELRLFLYTATARGLDPLSRQIYAIMRWDTGEQRQVMTVQTGIDGFRSIAERTGLYDGQSEPLWCGDDGRWTEVWLGPDHPQAARIAIYKKGTARPFVGIATWESYHQTYRKDNAVHLAPMWRKMPDVMLAKCAEALAIRKAFPEQIGGLMSHDEMGQADNPVLDGTIVEQPARPVEHHPAGRDETPDTPHRIVLPTQNGTVMWGEWSQTLAAKLNAAVDEDTLFAWQEMNKQSLDTLASVPGKGMAYERRIYALIDERSAALRAAAEEVRAAEAADAEEAEAVEAEGRAETEPAGASAEAGGQPAFDIGAADERS